MAKGAKRVSDDARSSEVAPNAGVLGEGVAAVYLPVDALRPHPKNPRIHGAPVAHALAYGGGGDAASCASTGASTARTSRTRSTR